MLPVGDDNSQRRTMPYVTYGLIAINVAVFIYQMSLGSGVEQFFQNWAVIPSRITSGDGYLTLITSQFMHGGLAHIGGNMLYLFIFGDNVEDAFGHIGYLAFYLATGVVAGLAQVLVDPSSNVPSLGASGAIAGVLGAYLVLFPKAQINTLIFIGIFFTFTRLSALIVIGFWAVLQFFSGFASLSSSTAQTGGGGVAYFAHIGGFVAGVAIALILGQFVRRPPNYQNNPPSYQR